MERHSMSMDWRFNVKIAVILHFIYKLNIISIKILVGFIWEETAKLTLKFVWKGKGSRTIGKEQSDDLHFLKDRYINQ